MIDQVTTEWGGRMVLWLATDGLPECESFFQQHAVDAIGINPARGYASNSLAPAAPFRATRGLIIVVVGKDFDITDISSFKDLELLVLSKPSGAVDVSAFPKLREFSADWHPAIKIAGSNTLTNLSLLGYGPKQRDLSELLSQTNLTSLELTRPHLRSLAGLNRLQDLRHLDISFMRGIDLRALEGLEKIESVALESCSQLENTASLGKLKSLRQIKINDCRAVPSISFVSDLPLLEDLRFVGTTVEDGNLEPLLRLKSAGFDDRGHYSHNSDEIDRLLATRAT
jgi:protein phosphatase 1 regulatory subunit 7